ncbi:hypothetical protein BH10PLA1_BH10PLA1_20420 [soil metagenome]
MMQQKPQAIDYASVKTDRCVSAPAAVISCVPGMFALVTYSAHQSIALPKVLGYLFWPMLAIGVVVGFICVIRFRRAYRGRKRPWFVSVSVAARFLVLLVGIPFLLLLIVGALTGNLR